MQVQKRNLEIVDFDFSKIMKAVQAAQNLTETINYDNLRKYILLQTEEKEVVSVEAISDLVEDFLMLTKMFKTAKAFIIYRDTRTKQRTTENESNATQGKINVIKSSGATEPFSTDKIFATISLKGNGLAVDYVLLEKEIMKGIFDNITTADILKLLIISSLSFSDRSKDYDTLASRLFLQRIYKEVFSHSTTDKTFKKLYKQTFVDNTLHAIEAGHFKKELANFNIPLLSTHLKPERDYLFEYMGISTAYDKYLFKEGKKPLETPQAFWMRVAMGLAWNEPMGTDINEVAIEHYEVLSSFDGVHSTPTLFFSGLKVSQLASCGGYTINDSLESIMENNKSHAELSKWSYGLGFSVSKIRAVGSRVKSTNITSGGIIPFIKILNDTTACINRSGRKRGAAVAYIEPWHYEIESFLDLRKNTGDDRLRAHDLNTALWVPDLFMKRVEADASWWLFDPAETKSLPDAYGEIFEDLYASFEAKAEAGQMRLAKKVQAKVLWKQILSSLFTTGFPWITFKDPMNVRNNARHRGLVYSSNLCTEISQNTIPDVEMFNCFLASVNLANMYTPEGINWKKLKHTTKVLTHRLDNAQGHYEGMLKGLVYNEKGGFFDAFPLEQVQVVHHGKEKTIYAFEFEEGMRVGNLENSYLVEVVQKPKFVENNYYPGKEILRGAMINRSSGVGVMGWQDLLFKMRIPFDSDMATALLDEIMENIAFYAYETSNELAVARGACAAFAGSLPAQGILPLDSLELLDQNRGVKVNVNRNSTLDWNGLREKIKKTGLRNMWLLSPAPTATISTVVGTYPSIEALYSNLYVKENMQGTFMVVNSYLEEDLKNLGLWTDEVRAQIKKSNGRLLEIDSIPAELKLLYRDAFEVDVFKYIEQGAVMAKWIDQSHSRNIFVEEPTGGMLNKIYMEAWKQGLKTTYYLRSKGATRAEKSTQ